jgi:hypothetical protein
MKRNLIINSAVMSALLACGASAQVVNFHDANNGAISLPGVGYSELFAGQGAYPDPGNDIWNGFGSYGGYQSTDFYSGTQADPPSNWAQQPGNPGNPYAFYNGNTSTGTNLFDYDTGSVSTTGNATSGGQISPVTLSVSYAGDNGNIGNNNGGIPNGSPAYLLGYAATNSGGNSVTVILENVPPGTNYGLYLYGADYANDLGTTFSLDPFNYGNAHNGISSTVNGQNGKPAPTFAEGQNFVIFENVTPDSAGNITITAVPNNSAAITDVNGVQLIENPLPTAVGMNSAANVQPGQTATFSFSPVFAGEATTTPGYQWQFSNNGGSSWSSVGGNSPTLTVAGATALNAGLYRCYITNKVTSAVGVTPLASLSILSAGTNILQPTDTVFDFNNALLDSPYSDTEVFNTVPPPFNKLVSKAIDGTLNPYEIYGSNGSTAPFSGPVGFVDQPKIGPTVVTGLRIFTSGSHPEDDPIDYVLQGSTTGTNGPWVTISSGSLALPLARNIGGGAPINITNQVLQEVDFTNVQYESAYKLSFNNVRDNTAASNGVEVAEVQLLGIVSGPPVITSQISPSFSEVPACPGTSVTLTVAGSGTGPLSYQWVLNGSTVVQTSSSNSYTFGALAGTNTYTVTVSGPIAPSVTSATATVVGFDAPPVISLGSGAGWTVNNNGAGFTAPNPGIVTNQLTLIDNAGGEASSAFYNTLQYVGGFFASFDYIPGWTPPFGFGAGDYPPADGITFCLQNSAAGVNALGGSGGALGYGGITPSLAFEMNIFENVGVGVQVTTNGTTGGFFSTAPVSLTSSNPIYTQLYYEQGVLQVYLEDTVTLAIFTTNILVDLPTAVGGNRAYIGFTGGDGGNSSIEIVSNFEYSYTTVPTLSISAVPGLAVISWPVSVSSFFQLMQSTNVVGPWAAANVSSLKQTGCENVVTLPNSGTASFFRLQLVDPNKP